MGCSNQVTGLSVLQEEHPRQVKHYQYFSWPDHGVPNEPGGVLSFLDQVNRAQRSIPDSGPIVVHCRYAPGGVVSVASGENVPVWMEGAVAHVSQ